MQACKVNEIPTNIKIKSYEKRRNVIVESK